MILALVACAAFFGAQGIMQVVGASIGADARQLAVPSLVGRAPPAIASASPHTTSADAILHRNPFDSVTGPLDVVAAAADSAALEPAAPPDLSDPFHAPECDGVKVLVITASANPDWSFAALETTKDKAKSVLRAIEGGVESVHIIDGRTPHSLIAELFTDRGVGTLIRKD